MTMIDNQIEIAEGRNKYTVKLAVPKYSSGERNMQSIKAAFFGLQMNMFNTLVVFSVVLLLCASIIRAAPTTDELDNYTEATSPTPSTTKSPFTCYGRTPCGWAVYTRWERKFEYFMKNNCACADDKICKIDDDNVSIAAFVYRCFNRTSTDPVEEEWFMKQSHR
ncbi:uncharacterized protein LOC135831463 [Planococcus citri]|uniref:uncharacterized protein LOC135831463 n=1 Tax=Planococcus citri TaxID=170843 RepID=UPI0031F92D86